MPTTLPDTTTLGAPRLRIADRLRAIEFYRNLLGFTVIEEANGVTRLGAGEIPLIELVEQPGLMPHPKNAPGLFHVAVLLPDRPSLGSMLERLIRQRVPLGASDHLVSEALYLDDPDGNGLEIYCDRPREEWHWNDGEVDMATHSMDTAAVRAQARPPAEPYTLPIGTTIGHIHLQVGDLATAKAFYVDALGFAITTQSYPGALFVSAGGYHHHIALNVWHSRGKAAVPAHVAGLAHLTIHIPDPVAWAQSKARVEAKGIRTTEIPHEYALQDPWGTTVHVSTTGQSHV